MRTSAAICVLLLASALGACAREGTGGQTNTANNNRETQGGACSLAQLKGIDATVADATNGVAITFTSSKGDTNLEQLRENVSAMATANDEQGDAFAACPCAERAHRMGSTEAMPGGSEIVGYAREGTAYDRATARPIAADASVDKFATGAVLTLSAKDSSQAGALRSEVRQNVHALRQQCINEGHEGTWQGK
jgi:hypothetical protein